MIRWRYFAAALIGMSATALETKAATITQYVEGTISSSTVDTYGYFAPAGTSLKGLPIKIYFQYRTSDLYEHDCGAPGGAYCGVWLSKRATGPHSLKNPFTPGSILISLQLNGVSRSFAPFQQSQVYIYNPDGSSGQGQLTLTTGYLASKDAVAVAAVETIYTAPVVFGATLSPANNPTNGGVQPGNTNMVTIEIPPAGGKAADYMEQFTFTVTGSAR